MWRAAVNGRCASCLVFGSARGISETSADFGSVASGKGGCSYGNTGEQASTGRKGCGLWGKEKHGITLPSHQIIPHKGALQNPRTTLVKERDVVIEVGCGVGMWGGLQERG